MIVPGSPGNDTLNGTESNDQIYGYGGNDILYGHGGNDILDPGTGGDTVYGGSGDDTLVLGNSATIYDQVFELKDYVSTNYSRHDWNDGTASYSIYDYNEIEKYQFTGGSGGDKFDLRDRLVAGVRVYGNAGFDSVWNVNLAAVTAGITLDDSGVSRAVGAGAFLFLAVEEFRGNATTGAGNDLVQFAKTSDSQTIKTGAGNDTIQAGRGSDSVYGGSGIDRLVLGDNVATGDQIIEMRDYDGSAYDRHDWFDGATWNYTYDYAGEIEAYTFQGGSGGDKFDLNGYSGNQVTIVAGGAGIDEVWDANLSNASTAVTAKDDGVSRSFIAGTFNFNSIERFRGNITTGTGNDNVSFANVTDSQEIKTGAGNDTIHAGYGSDSVYGGSGTDRMILGSSTVTANQIVEFQDSVTSTYTRHDWYDGTTWSYTYDYGKEIETYTFLGGISDDVFKLNNWKGPSTVVNGGAGTDELWNSDFSSATTSMNVGDEGRSRSFTAGGHTITSIERFRGNVTTGSGNDVLDFRTQSESQILRAGGGNDTVYSGKGSDSIYGGSGVDVLVLGQSFSASAQTIEFRQAAYGDYIRHDWFDGTGWNYTYDYNSEFERYMLQGGRGNDTIEYSTSVAEKSVTLAGGLGNDTYNVSAYGATISEGAGQGSDVVNASITYRLTDNVETLILTGYNQIDATGNAGANRLVGNSSHNRLIGGLGADTMEGGLGNDTYTVDHAGDRVTEAVGAGADVVRSRLENYTLVSNVDRLVLLDKVKAGTGNGLANRIFGNTASNLLKGGLGNDTLYGSGGHDTLIGAGGTGQGEIDLLNAGGGKDVFVLGNAAGRFYDDRLAGRGTADYAYITSFRPNDDKLQLKGNASQYFLGASPLFNVVGKGLYFDSNSNRALDAGDEVIAIIRSPEAINAGNTIGRAIYV